MISLYIDTSSADVSLALYKDNDIFIKEDYIINKHSVYVLSYIDTLLKENNVNPKDIGKIYVVNGPGSFTGIRIGITIAKTIAYLNNIKLTPVSSLKQRIVGHTGSDYYLSLILFKNNNYYYGLYDKEYNTLKEEYNDISSINDIIDKYNPKIVTSTDNEVLNIKKNNIDIEKIINYYSDKEEYTSFDIKINYLKNPDGIEIR